VSDVEICVCISTRNRASLLAGLVETLEEQTIAKDRFEVIIVDNGSTDESWTRLRDLAASTPVNLTVLRNPPGGGPAAGRNRAWRASVAPLCAFTDDDCRPEPTWLATALVYMATQVIAAGAVRPPVDQEALIGPFSRIVVSAAPHAAWAATANLLVLRSALETVGGFDERYLQACGEDTDLALRIESALDTRVGFLPGAVVWHRVEQTRLRDLLRDTLRWADIPLVLARHPKARQRLLVRGLFWKQTHISLLLFYAGLAMGTRRPTALLLTLPWLHDRTCRQPLSETRVETVLSLPGALALDSTELATMIRGSLRHRSVVL
jgi:GT2 family glycosyltransferase